MKHTLIAALAGLALVGCTSLPASPADVRDPSPALVAEVAEAVRAGPDYAPVPYVQVAHPEWTRDAVIYQLNTRQFTAEGTFAAAETHLPRLAEMGVDVIWLMPIHPIGEVNRKGSLGSPYAVKDYAGVNPEFGTRADLKRFIDAAHDLEMKVILDWVANHTAWDNPLTETQPDWYQRDWKGDFHPPLWTDWDDVIELDFSQPALREYMTDVMVAWVRDVGVDGFRCDVAGFVPLDFWETLRAELDAVKPVFMLAEWQTRDMHQHAFDATYAWGWKEAMQPIARGEADVGALRGYFYGEQNSWPGDAYRMVYTSNHDQNSWDGTAPEIYGDALEAAIVMSFVSEGIPLIYNGQEAGLDHQLEFFEKDEIVWREHSHGALFTALATFKADNKALWNGAAGARLEELATGDAEHVFAFIREGEADAVAAVFNLSDQPRTIGFETERHYGDYKVAFGDQAGTTLSFDAETTLDLPAWGYLVVRADR